MSTTDSLCFVHARNAPNADRAIASLAILATLATCELAANASVDPVRRAVSLFHSLTWLVPWWAVSPERAPGDSFAILLS